MRKLFLSILILSATVISAQNLDIKDLPSSVKSKFESQYPNIKDAKWGKVVANYEAGFTHNGAETSVLYDIKGILLETVSEIKISELPATVIDYVNKNYGWKKIKHAVKIVDGNGRTSFRITIGVKGMDLVFDFQGNFLRQVKM
jgi:hypothetical protein